MNNDKPLPCGRCGRHPSLCICYAVAHGLLRRLRRLLALAPLAFACSGVQHPPGCGPDDQAALDAWYQAQLVKECSAYAPIKKAEDCPEFERVTAAYQKRNEELFVRCHP